MDKINTERWERATKLACPCLRQEENPVGYREGEPTTLWLAIGRDPCPSCKNSSCFNCGSKFDEPKRLIILKETNGK